MNKKFVAVLLASLLGIGGYLTFYSISSITASTPYEQFEEFPTIVIDAGHPESD